MFKKSLITLFIIFSMTFSFSTLSVSAETNSPPPKVNCHGLPGCVDKKIEAPTPASKNKNLGIEIVTNVVGNVIQYVSVFAVLALVLSGMMYLVSGGEEEKVKKAKSWIVWSLVGVFLSVSAWGIINMLNNITIS